MFDRLELARRAARRLEFILDCSACVQFRTECATPPAPGISFWFLGVDSPCN